MENFKACKLHVKKNPIQTAFLQNNTYATIKTKLQTKQQKYNENKVPYYSRSLISCLCILIKYVLSFPFKFYTHLYGNADIS